MTIDAVAKSTITTHIYTTPITLREASLTLALETTRSTTVDYADRIIRTNDACANANGALVALVTVMTLTLTGYTIPEFAVDI